MDSGTMTIYLNKDDYKKLQDLLDKPPKANEALKELMNKKHGVEVDVDEIQSNN